MEEVAGPQQKRVSVQGFVCLASGDEGLPLPWLQASSNGQVIQRLQLVSLPVSQLSSAVVHQELVFSGKLYRGEL